MARLWPHLGRAMVVGITGSPGAGKSTLTDQLARALRAEGQRVGILAVDPTSPFSGGAILGDRIRMGRCATDPGIFIRSMATRGALGGLARATVFGVSDGLVSNISLILGVAGGGVAAGELDRVGRDPCGGVEAPLEAVEEVREGTGHAHPPCRCPPGPCPAAWRDSSQAT